MKALEGCGLRELKMARLSLQLAQGEKRRPPVTALRKIVLILGLQDFFLERRRSLNHKVETSDVLVVFVYFEGSC
jgi:hypothetical protein